MIANLDVGFHGIPQILLVAAIQAHKAIARAGLRHTNAAAIIPGKFRDMIHWHTADEQQAQDATQETFLKVVRWLDSCGGFQGAFRPFLYKIAKNTCIDLNRTMERSEVSLESLPGEPAYQESGFAAAEEKANLRALTAQLEPEQREL